MAKLFTKEELKEATHALLALCYIIDWAIWDGNCSEAIKNRSSYACMDNSLCVDSQNAPSYLCRCNEGFRGNPCLSGSDGCRDIDEGGNSTLNLCSQTCHNLYGTSNCSCLQGYKGDGFKNGTGCVLLDKSNKVPITEVSLGTSVFLLVLGIFISSLCWVGRKRKLKNIKKKFFEKNQDLMLWEQLSHRHSYNEMAKLFTKEELKEATNNFISIVLEHLFDSFFSLGCSLILLYSSCNK